MKEITAKIHRLLIARGKTLSVAESCTGGMLSSLLTKLSGSSEYFKLGVVAYSNKSKTSVLGIAAAKLRKNGAVSEPVAMAMAESVRKISQTDFGIGITGIAGPTGATPHKPVGTVFIAITTKNTTICERRHFNGNRSTMRKKSVMAALQLLKKIL